MDGGRDAVGPDVDVDVEVDVVVVGAGPAGASAAIACASRGLRVALLDQRRLPHTRPGETLHPGVEAPLRELGALGRIERAGFPRHAGVHVSWGGPERLEPYGADADGPWLGFQASGARFDGLLVERAQELGVVVHPRCRALAPTVRAGRVVGVETSAGSMAAGHVVDAGGGGHWLARRLGLPLDRRSPRLIARYGYRRGEWPARDAAPALVADRAGWTWTARVGDGLYHWTRLDLPPAPRRGRDLPLELAALAPCGRTRSADVSWRALTQPAGPGYVAVGDAAMVLDPSSSHGVLRAMLMGMQAARLICGALADPRRESELCAAYSRFAAEWFGRDVGELRGLYGRLPGGAVLAGRASRARDDAGRAAVSARPDLSTRTTR